MKRLYSIIILLLVIITIQCNSGGKAIVTINVGSQQKISYFDHILHILTFAKKANAAVPTNVASILFTVEASDIATIIGTIPLETGSVTIKLKPGKNRTFTVYAYNSNNYIIYAGKTTVDLQPGNNTVGIVMVNTTKFTIDSSTDIGSIDLAIGNGIPYIAYIKSSQINIKYLSGITLQTIDTTSLNYPAYSVDLEYYNNTIYIVTEFSDYPYNNYCKISKFNGSSWNLIRDDTNTGYSYSLKINSAGAYIAYINNSSNNPTIEYYNWANWTNLSTLMDVTAYRISMAYDSANNIYILYSIEADKIHVKKYSGSSWTDFPNENPIFTEAVEESIAIDANDVVYVSFYDYINKRVAVVKCPQVGNGWTHAAGSDIYVSDQGRKASFIKMAFDSKNTLYVVYCDFEVVGGIPTNYQLHIKRVNGSNWEEVDVINLPDGHSVLNSNLKIAITGDVCYIAYVDYYDSQRDVILYTIFL